MKDSDAAAARSNYSVDGLTFYMVDAHDCPTDQETPYGCGQPKLIPLAGSTQLDGTAWGGVTLDDMVISSYQGYKLNKNQNGYVMPELSKAVDGEGAQGDFIYQNGIQTPGFFSFPICDADTVSAAWNEVYANRASPCPTYPCCKY